MRDLADLLSRFPEGKWRGDEYITACPMPGCHHHTPKLYISQGNNGSAVMRCAKCGATGPQIMGALGLPQSFLFLDNPQDKAAWNPPAAKEERKPKRDLVFRDIPETYFRNKSAIRERLHTYRDASGEVLSHKVIFRDPATGKKEIQWFSPVAGGFAPGLCGRQIPLYHFPELLAADPSQPIYFVEGEKDCDTLAQLGRLAVSAPNGGNQTTWKPEFNQGLEGRDIVVITDNDATGAKYGQFVAENTAQLTRSLRIVPAASVYPAVPEKGDITDIVELIGSAAALSALDQAARSTAPQQIQATRPQQIPQQKPATVRRSKNLRPADFSDAGNMEVFIDNFRDQLLYTDALGWLHWDGCRWKRDDHSALAMATDLSGLMLRDAIQQNRDAKVALAEAQAAEQAGTGKPEDTERAKALAAVANSYLAHAKQTRNANKLQNMVKLSASQMVIEADQLDAAPEDLNTPAGIVDLRTGKIRPHDREAKCTKITAAAPGKQGAKMWADFLDTITQKDGSLAGFLQMVAGMALFGRVYEEKILFAHGGGRNGKSTFFNALGAVLGDYAGTIDIDVLTTEQQKRGAALATMRGKRLITAGELEEGRRLSVATVKRICSTDKFQIEEKYKAPENVTPSHSIVLFTNHLPRVGSNDEGTWRRIQVIPFNATIPDSDCRMNYAEDLIQQAGPAIMAWAIEGAVLFARNRYRLHTPDKVAEITADYRGREDWFELFTRECCERGEALRVPSKELYSCYKHWAEESGDYCRRQTDFNAALEAHGFKKITPKNRAVWIGLDLAK